MIRQNRKYNVANVKGFTLVEVLVVVIIIGILSGMGVAGLQGAVQNNRIKDAGINVAAYMERTANEASRLSSQLCVKVVGDQMLKTYPAACSEDALGDAIDSLVLDSKNKFIANSAPSECTTTFSKTTSATYVPKLGLSATPAGCFVIRYGGSDKYAAAIKTVSKNTVYYKISYDNGSSWSGI